MSNKSCLKETLSREKTAVGPCGKCEISNLVGVPRCSCSSTISVRPLVSAERTMSGGVMVPRLSRFPVGNRRRISFENVRSFVEASIDVVVKTRGSLIMLKFALHGLRLSYYDSRGMLVLVIDEKRV